MSHSPHFCIGLDDALGIDGPQLCAAKVEPCCIDPTVKCAILGASRVLAQIRDAAVLIHGPKGCAFPAYEATLYDPLKFNFSEMCEHAVIFGGEKALEEKIYDTYYDNMPSLIGLVTTCSSEIIGDDVAAVARNTVLPVPMLCLEGVGFKRDHWEATDHAMTELAKLVCSNKKRRDVVADGSINLISHVGLSPRWQDEACQLEAELTRFIGYPVRRLYCRNQLAELNGIERAALTLQVSPQVGGEPAAWLKQRYGIPACAPALPVGLEQSIAWMLAVVQQLGVPLLEDLDSHADRIRSRFRDGLGRVTTFRPFEQLQRLSTVVVAEPSTALAYHHFLVNELEIAPRAVILKSQHYHQFDLAALRAAFPDTCFEEIRDTMHLKRRIHELAPQLLLGNDIEYLLAKPVSDPIYINISYPGVRRIKMQPRSYLGFEGVLNLLEDLFNGVIDRYA